MLRLASPTDPRYVDVVLADLDHLLVDHAHCEHKAAVTALSFCFWDITIPGSPVGFDFSDSSWQATPVQPLLAASLLSVGGDADTTMWAAVQDLAALNATATARVLVVEAVDQGGTVVGADRIAVVSGVLLAEGTLSASDVLAQATAAVAATKAVVDAIKLKTDTIPGIIGVVIGQLLVTSATSFGQDALRIMRGDLTPIHLTFLQENGTPRDLTDFVAVGGLKLTVKDIAYRDDEDDAHAAFQVTGASAAPTTGIATFMVTAAQSELLTLGTTYDYDVQGDAGSGAVTTLAVGEFRTLRDVTRVSSATP